VETYLFHNFTPETIQQQIICGTYAFFLCKDAHRFHRHMLSSTLLEIGEVIVNRDNCHIRFCITINHTSDQEIIVCQPIQQNFTHGGS